MPSYQFTLTAIHDGATIDEAAAEFAEWVTLPGVTDHAEVMTEAGLAEQARDNLYVGKVHQYVADPAFDANVVNYLRTMVDEYRQQARLYGLVGLDAKVAEAKAYAYTDALRVLDDAIEAAFTASDI